MIAGSSSRRCGAARLVSVLVTLSSPLASAEGIDHAKAKAYFQEADAVSRKDRGQTWGLPLYGPMLFVEPATRAVVANQVDQEGQLHASEGVFVGTLPPEINVANTAMKWAGVHWTMILWPLPENERDRMRLMMHELWHRIQDDLALPASNPANNHLDTRDGRVWMQLEWRALERALRLRDDKRREALVDVWVFRNYRRSLFPQAAEEERALELNEGLAEYTGVKLSTPALPMAVNEAARLMRETARNESYVRSFAYASGPAYGLLLDELQPAWKAELRKRDDFGECVRGAGLLTLPEGDLKTEALTRAKPHNGDKLMAEEDKREQQRQTKLAELRSRFINGPVLVLPLTKPSVQFNPTNLQPLDDAGTVYPTARITDVWGILEVQNGVLLSTKWDEARVVAPGDASARPLRGDGWTLTLNEGWTAGAGPQPGQSRLVAPKPEAPKTDAPPKP